MKISLLLTKLSRADSFPNKIRYLLENVCYPVPGVFAAVTRSHQLHVPPGPWGLFQKREKKSPKRREGKEVQLGDAQHPSAYTGVAAPAEHSSISCNFLKKVLRLLGNSWIPAVPAAASAAPAGPGRLVAQSRCSPSPILPRLAQKRSPGSLMLKIVDFLKQSIIYRGVGDPPRGSRTRPWLNGYQGRA